MASQRRAHELEETRQKIKRTGDDIALVAEDLKVARAAGNQKLVDDLRADLSDLRKKENNLIEKENNLIEIENNLIEIKKILLQKEERLAVEAERAAERATAAAAPTRT